MLTAGEGESESCGREGGGGGGGGRKRGGWGVGKMGLSTLICVCFL